MRRDVEVEVRFAQVVELRHVAKSDAGTDVAWTDQDDLIITTGETL